MPRNKKNLKSIIADTPSEKVTVVSKKKGPLPLSEIVPNLFWRSSKIEYGYPRKGGVLLASKDSHGKWKIGDFLTIRNVEVDGKFYNVPHSILVPTTEADEDGIGEGRKSTKVLRHHLQWHIFRDFTEYKPRHSVPLGRRVYDGVTTSFPKYKPPPYAENFGGKGKKKGGTGGGNGGDGDYDARDDPDHPDYVPRDKFEKRQSDYSDDEETIYGQDFEPRQKGGELRNRDDFFLNGADTIIGIG